MSHLPVAWAVKIDSSEDWPGFRWMRSYSYDKVQNWTLEIHRANKFHTETDAKNEAATLVLKHPDLIGKVHIVKVVAKSPNAHGIGMHGGWVEAKYVKRRSL